MVSNIYQDTVAIFIIDTMYWIFIGIVLFIWKFLYNIINDPKLPVNICESKSDFMEGSNIINIDMTSLKSLIPRHRVVPLWIDQIHDLIVACIMIYFGYVFLPLFYMLHIVAIIRIGELSSILQEELDMKRALKSNAHVFKEGYDE